MSGQFRLGIEALKKCANKYVFDAKKSRSHPTEYDHISVSQTNNTQASPVNFKNL